MLMAPVPVFTWNVELVVVILTPPLPAFVFTDVVPKILPIVITRDEAGAPILIAPVDESDPTEIKPVPARIEIGPPVVPKKHLKILQIKQCC